MAQIPEEVMNALRLARAAFFELANEAGDVPTWNKGGQAYEASQAVKRVLEKEFKPERKECYECGKTIRKPKLPIGEAECHGNCRKK